MAQSAVKIRGKYVKPSGLSSENRGFVHRWWHTQNWGILLEEVLAKTAPEAPKNSTTRAHGNCCRSSKTWPPFCVRGTVANEKTCIICPNVGRIKCKKRWHAGHAYQGNLCILPKKLVLPGFGNSTTTIQCQPAPTHGAQSGQE